jgi:DNA segregation ATPase FtsK/SpoIIIE, S-DNA-T family
MKVKTIQEESTAIPFKIEVFFLFSLSFSLFSLLALATYSRLDPSWNHQTLQPMLVHNMTGYVGAWWADRLFTLMGWPAYALILSALCFTLYTIILLFQKKPMPTARAIIRQLNGLILSLIATCALSSIFIPAQPNLPFGPGGLLGHQLGWYSLMWFEGMGSFLIWIPVLISGLSLTSGYSMLAGLDNLFTWAQRSTDRLKAHIIKQTEGLRSQYANLKSRLFFIQSKETQKKTPPLIDPNKIAAEKSSFSKRSTMPTNEPSAAQTKQQVIASDPSKTGEIGDNQTYNKPPTNLLTQSEKKTFPLQKEQCAEMGDALKQALAHFGVEVTVDSYHPGPVITRYELKPKAGTKASKITGLSKDIARSLSVHSVRVVEVIPGKSVIGIEIPNTFREKVSLHALIKSDALLKNTADLATVLGKDIAGEPVVANLAKMPHLLVAGTTGSGKSVFINSMLISLLYKSTPDQIRMILIDPKMLELAVYENIPHLLTPVVTDMNLAGNALRWCVTEMDLRYRFMAALGVRNIEGFNRKIETAIQAGKPILNPFAQNPEEAKPLDPLPKILVVADEFADMMMVVGNKKIEVLITRLAQKARAAGIHLVLATQRPSVDVITGLIKANIPSRIAFQVSSRIDSRTILDQQGAEQLLGAGDMLYLPIGAPTPQRVHGAFVSDDEVHRVIDHLKKQKKAAQYPDDILSPSILKALTEKSQPEHNNNAQGEEDALYNQAVAIVTQTRKASISFLQRRLQIGFNRAANLIETMEAAGVIAQDDQGQRRVIAPPPIQTDETE